MKTTCSAPQVFLLATGFSGVLFIVVFVLLGLLAPGYRTAYDAISSLEFSTLGAAQQANFFVFGLLLCLFAVGLRRELVGGRGALLIPIFQAIGGLGVIGDALFIRDPLHTAFDLVAFNSALIVLFLFAWRFRREPRWKGWTTYSVLTGIAMMVFLAAFGAANHLGGPAGIFEKLATCTRTLWSAIFVIRVLKGTSLREHSN